MGYMEWIRTWEPVPRWEPWPEWDFLAEPPEEGEGPFCNSLCDCVRQEGLHGRYWGQEGEKQGATSTGVLW